METSPPTHKHEQTTWHTHTIENITFPELRGRALKISSQCDRNVYMFHTVSTMLVDFFNVTMKGWSVRKPVYDVENYNTIMLFPTFQTKTFTCKLFKPTKHGIPSIWLANAAGLFSWVRQTTHSRQPYSYYLAIRLHPQAKAHGFCLIQ